MRILTRYILREVLSHAVLGSVLFTFVLFMRDLGRVLELLVRGSASLHAVTLVFSLHAAEHAGPDHSHDGAGGRFAGA